MNIKFKKTEIGNIPKEWEIERLDKVMDFKNGYAFNAKQYTAGGKIVIRMSNISNDGKLQLTEDNTKFCSINEYLKLNDFHLKKGDLIIAMTDMSPTLGIIGHTAVINEDDKYILNQRVGRIRISLNKCIVGFIHYYTNCRCFIDYIKKGASRAVQSNVSTAHIKNALVPLPSIPEQQKIAEILGTVDEAIGKVAQAIAKTKRLKKGLMQKLLTKGIGHKEFKDTEIGRIPKEWGVVRLGESNIAEIRRNKFVSGIKKVAFIPMELIPDSRLFVNYEIKPMEKVRSFTYCEKGDLLLAKITPSLENSKQGIVPDVIPDRFALATTEVFPIACKEINKFFLFYVLKFPKYRNRIIASMTGTTGRQRASKESVERLQIPLPPLCEQRKIAEILDTVYKRLELLKDKKQKFKRIKRGLMNDLLTGRKRVKL